MVFSFMVLNYPNDTDGDALRRVADGGSDMSKPMDIEVALAVPSEAIGRRVAALIAQCAYQARVYQDEQDGSGSVYCTRHMLATYEAIVAAQAELDELSRPFGGYSDGWGTFGNNEPV
jgi:hypothetical protein